MTQIIVRENTADDEILAECQQYVKKCRLEKTDVWLDIGAHIGCFTCMIAPKVKQVIAYEPESKNFTELQSNIELNGYKNVVAVNSAVVGNYDKERKFHVIEHRNTGVHSFFPRDDFGVGGETETIVNCENIDDIVERYGVTAIKMDCEGAEVEILTSFKGLDRIRELIFEYHPTLIKEAIDKQKVLDDLIARTRDNFMQFKVDKRTDVAIIHGRR